MVSWVYLSSTNDIKCCVCKKHLSRFPKKVKKNKKQDNFLAVGCFGSRKTIEKLNDHGNPDIHMFCLKTHKRNASEQEYVDLQIIQEKVKTQLKKTVASD